MICDLHSHSSVSDGMLSPEALVAAAAEQRVDVLALTDHDDVSGVHAATARGRALGVRLLPGVEISVSEDEGRVQMHVLGLGVRPEHPDLLETLRGLREARQGRAASARAPTTPSSATCGAGARPTSRAPVSRRSGRST